jgi:hypothetical protein
LSDLQFYRIWGKFHDLMTSYLSDIRGFLYQILPWVTLLALAGKLSSTVSPKGPSLDNFFFLHKWSSYNFQ